MKRLADAFIIAVVASAPELVWAQDTIRGFSLKDGVNDENEMTELAEGILAHH